MNRKYKRLTKYTVLFALGAFSSRLFSFFLLPLYTNTLSTKDYGTIDLVTTTVTLLVYILTLNIQEAVMRFVLDDWEKRREILSYGFKVIFLSICWLGVFILWIVVRHTDLLDFYIWFFIWISFITNSLYGLFYHYIQGINKIEIVVLTGVIQPCMVLGLSLLLLVKFQWGIAGYFTAIISGDLISLFLFCMVVIKDSGWKVVFVHTEKTIKKGMIAYCIPLIFNNVAWWINVSLDKYFISIICGVDKNGLYSAASKVSTILSACFSLFLQAWRLSAIQEFDSEDQDKFFSNTYSLFHIIAVVLCSVLIILNIPISRILFAKDFFSAWQYSSVLLVSNIFNALAGFAGSIFGAVKNTKIYALSTILTAVLNVVLNLMLIPRFGVQGAAVATLISFIFMWLIRIWIVKRYIHWKLHILPDLCCYVLVLLQVLAEHVEGHAYWLQAFLLGGIVFINYKTIKGFLKEMKKIR